MWPRSMIMACGVVLSVACSSSTTTEAPESDAPACENYSGTWNITGCLIKQCVIAQSGCEVTFNCTTVLNTPTSATGTASGKEVEFSSTDLHCTLATAGKGLAGDCTGEAGACQLTGSLL